MTSITSREAHVGNHRLILQPIVLTVALDLELATATSLQSCRSYLPNDPPQIVLMISITS